MQRSMHLQGILRKSFQKEVKSFVCSILFSYSQIFFSKDYLFAVLILLVTFFDFYTGLSGFLSVLTASTAGYLLHFDRNILKKGVLGYNSLLVGMGLGAIYSPDIYLFIIIILASLFTHFVSVSLQGVIGKYGLPILSVPFILCLWTFLLATNAFSHLGISERGIYTLNELYAVGGIKLVKIYDWFNRIDIPASLRAYFISLSAILFQFNMLAGFILAIGLLMFSRIAFSLSVIGFYLAYGFYLLIGADVPVYDYTYFGFNYILTSIALGGFFIIASRNAYLWLVLVVPIVAVVTLSVNAVFIHLRLPVYALPFNMVVLLFLYMLKFRVKYSYSLSEVVYQYNSPEKNLYVFLNNKERFRYKFFTPVNLPFFGKWTVSQGHDGEITHKGDYRFAWDFVITDPHGSQFRNEGNNAEDYFCFNKPVLAPAKGLVEEVKDGIEDNLIGQVNLIENWGNAVVIRHENGVYSKLCHLRKGSVKVKRGSEVDFGQHIGNCGNSGRSPYPHLHFQLQPYPYIGSITMDYPFSNYIAHSSGSFELKMHAKPLQNDLVSNIESNSLISNAFHFVPGQILKFSVLKGKLSEPANWEVRVNEYNQTYLFCRQTGALAYYEKDEHLFYFTHYEGTKKSPLFHLFKALYKVQTGFYANLVIKDQFPLHLTSPAIFRWFHDFISPFVLLLKSVFEIEYSKIDDSIAPENILLNSCSINYFLNKPLGKTSYSIHLDASGIESIEVFEKKKSLLIKR